MDVYKTTFHYGGVAKLIRKLERGDLVGGTM